MTERREQATRFLLQLIKLYGNRAIVVKIKPELLQFVDDVLPIFHGERTLTPHHYCHSDVVVGTIDICVPKAVAKIEVLTGFALVNVLTDLRWAFHVQDKGLSLIAFYHLSQYLL